MLLLLCYKGTESFGVDTQMLALRALVIWMFVSKFIKLLGHYIRYPVDFVLLPVSILFGYFHGAIKLYAMFTLNVVRIPEPVSIHPFKKNPPRRISCARAVVTVWLHIHLQFPCP